MKRALAPGALFAEMVWAIEAATANLKACRQTRSQSPVLEFYAHTIQNNVLTVWKSLQNACEEVEVNYDNFRLTLALRSGFSFKSEILKSLNSSLLQCRGDFEVLYDFKHREKLSDKVVDSLLAVSRTSLLEECQRKKRILPLPYNYKYFVQHTNRMIADGYIPTEVDVLYSYSPTIGLDNHMIRMGKIRYDVMELPGHRIFRRRWADFFRNTAVVVFLIDLCELCDTAFYSGHLKNKTISIYERLVQNDLLSRVGFILLFNKKDAFEDMARGFDFKQLSSNLRSSQDALSFYRTTFMAASPPKRSFHHVVSLINAPSIGMMLAESLGRVLKSNAQSTTIN
ncbi:unnamed protein product [Nippostrongylus brasiliensis]|uniref:G protein alpha subunit n=1 Tax=Nippostrongylus brasiliensis TaxID=27835 RepID=A0A158QXN8_NIPBR|nr:unnamed protein product [Nippostrongylus brasiliensis]